MRGTGRLGRSPRERESTRRQEMGAGRGLAHPVHLADLEHCAHLADRARAAAPCPAKMGTPGAPGGVVALRAPGGVGTERACMATGIAVREVGATCQAAQTRLAWQLALPFASRPRESAGRDFGETTVIPMTAVDLVIETTGGRTPE